MAAYVNTAGSINLTNARAAFRTVELQTLTWLVGSVAVPGYSETEDAHVFVHADGWIVAYYERGSPVSRVMHWTSHGVIGDHKLRQVLMPGWGSWMPPFWPWWSASMNQSWLH